MSDETPPAKVPTPKEPRKSLVIVNTGNGKGKTTAALGVLFRAWGRGYKVVMLQFIKSTTSNYGETKAAKKIGIEVVSLGGGFTWLSKDIEKDKALARELWEQCKAKISSGEYDIVVLDEFTYPLTYGWLPTEEIIEFLKTRPARTHVIITGRDAPQVLIDYADLVTEMREIKHPFQQGLKAQPGIEFLSPRESIDAASASIRPPDADARETARMRQLGLTKPAGSLGRLEELAIWAAGVRREAAQAIGRKVIVVAAADHGVAPQGVSAYPQDVTWQMMANFLAGGAAINVLARHAGASVRVVDAGVLRDADDARVTVAKTRCGTDDMSRGPAMSRDEAEALIARGIELAREECSAGAGVIALGDMGIGNTTAAAAITSVITGTPPGVTAGRGTGIDDAGFQAKVAVIERAITLNMPDASDGVDVLAKVGGFELAFLTGLTIGAASCGVPVVLDGYPTTAAALVAAAIAPASTDYMLASHLSAEPGHRIALGHLGLRPLLELDMRLGEGSGAALAITILEAALRLPREMATFGSAGVSRASNETPPEA